MLTQERLKELLDYDPETGVFVWRVANNGNVKVGNRAGSAHHTGYIHIKIDRKEYGAHRLAWLYTHGRWPRGVIDHMNRVRDDNRLENLREVTRQQNAFNSKARGYYWSKQNKKWRASIRLNGSLTHLGYYNTEEEANTAYVKAKAEYHKF